MHGYELVHTEILRAQILDVTFNWIWLPFLLYFLWRVISVSLILFLFFNVDVNVMVLSHFDILFHVVLRVV